MNGMYSDIIRTELNIDGVEANSIDNAKVISMGSNRIG